MLLVYDGQQTEDSLEVLEAFSQKGFVYSSYSSLEELESRIFTSPADFVFVIQGDPAEDELILSKSLKFRLRSHLRNTRFTVLLNENSSEIIAKEYLLAGFELVFKRPVSISLMLNLLLQSMQGNEEVGYFGEEFKEPEGVTSEIECFGRLGKISRAEDATFTVETNLSPKVGEVISLKNEIFSMFDDSSAEFRVKKIEKTNLYYKYFNKLSLIPENQAVREFIYKWRDSPKIDFVFPKTKILWMRNTALSEKENFFNNRIYSLYVREPDLVNSDYLNRVFPSIVITGETSQTIRDELQAWLNHNPEVLRLDGENIEENFKLRTRNMMLERAEDSIKHSVFIDRKSRFSRCAFQFDGEVKSISKACVKILSSKSLPMGTIVSVRLIHPKGKSSLYMRITDVGEVLNEKVELVGLVQPLTKDKLPLVRLDGEDLNLGEVEATYNPKFKAKEFVLFSRKNIILACFCLFVLILLILNGRPLARSAPGSMSDLLRSIREAFN